MQSARQFAASAQTWGQRFLPLPLAIQTGERWRIIFGSAFGILFTGLVSKWFSSGLTPWLVAPIGASAVLVFALPSSPLAQPWSVVGGNTISAIIGTACVLLIPNTTLSAALAVSIAIGAMIYLRCLHPPGGAAALFVVLANNHSWGFVMFPILCNSVVLVVLGLIFNTLTGRDYPHKHVLQKDTLNSPESSRFSRADLNAALQHYNQVIDVDTEDLVELLQYAEAAAFQRTLGELRCRDIMTPDPQCVEFGTGLSEAWASMRKYRIKALPVVDRMRRVVGIVTVADFLRHAQMDERNGLTDRLQNMLRPSRRTHSDNPEVVGQIMTRRVRVAGAHRHAMELLPLFSEAGHHHIPIINDENRLVGILTQSDLVRSLSKAVKP